MTDKRERVWGLRDVGEYKAYRRGAVFFVSHRNAERFRSVELPKSQADIIVNQTKSGFVQAIELMLQHSKRQGLPAYREIKHG
jgi:hypothetical protein